MAEYLTKSKHNNEEHDIPETARYIYLFLSVKVELVTLFSLIQKKRTETTIPVLNEAVLRGSFTKSSTNDSYTTIIIFLFVQRIGVQHFY